MAPSYRRAPQGACGLKYKLKEKFPDAGIVGLRKEPVDWNTIKEIIVFNYYVGLRKEPVDWN